jgi:hypothetical protein
MIFYRASMREGLDSAQKWGAPFGPSRRYHAIGRRLGFNKHLFFFWWEDWNNIPHIRTFNTHPQPNHGVTKKLKRTQKKIPKRNRYQENEFLLNKLLDSSKRTSTNAITHSRMIFGSFVNTKNQNPQYKKHEFQYNYSQKTRKGVKLKTQTKTKQQRKPYSLHISKQFETIRAQIAQFPPLLAYAGTVNFSEHKVIFQNKVNEIHDFQWFIILINTMTIRRYIKPLIETELKKNSYRKKIIFNHYFNHSLNHSSD